MKTQLLILLFSLCFFSLVPIAIYSQDQKPDNVVEELPYKPFDEFDNDTIAFIEYNFVKRPPAAYRGMTVREVLELIYFPYVDFGTYAFTRSDYVSLEVYIVNEDSRVTPDGKAMRLYVIIGLEPTVPTDTVHSIRREDRAEYFKNLKAWSAYTDEHTIKFARYVQRFRKGETVKGEIIIAERYRREGEIN